MENAEIKAVLLEQIIVDQFNLRGDDFAVDSPSQQRLSVSIFEKGLLQNLGGIENGDGTFTLLYGLRRYRAIEHYLKEHFPTVPMRIFPKSEVNELEGIKIALTENDEDLRKPLNPIVLAEKLRQLRDLGFTNRDIADAMGYKTAGAVTAVVQLIELEPEIQAALKDGRLSFSHGKAMLLIKHNRQQQLESLRQFDAYPLRERSSRVMENIVHAVKAGKEWQPMPLTLPASAKLQELSSNRHKLTIVFDSMPNLREVLADILELNSDPASQSSAFTQELEAEETGLFDQIKHAFG